MHNLRSSREVGARGKSGKIIGMIFILVLIIGGVWVWRTNVKNPWYCENGVWITDKETEVPQPTDMCPGSDGNVLGERVKPSKEMLDIDSKKIAEGIDIRVKEPYVNETISSPLKISGEAKNWYVNNAFDIMLLSSDGKTIATGRAEATGDIVDDGYVSFEAEIDFDPEGLVAGDLVFHKDEAAEIPGSFSFPVFFK